MSILDTLQNNDFTKWFILCVTKKYAEFNGRARRKEYWMFQLVGFLIVFALIILTGILSSIAGFLGMIGLILYAVVACAIVLPGIAAAVRRLHDVGKSGWFLLLGLVPIVSLYLLYLLIIDGTPGPNKYGPSPKAA